MRTDLKDTDLLTRNELVGLLWFVLGMLSSKDYYANKTHTEIYDDVLKAFRKSEDKIKS